MPWDPTRAAEELTLRSPPSTIVELQADKLPLSNPSAKIRSPPGVTLGVNVWVDVGG